MGKRRGVARRSFARRRVRRIRDNWDPFTIPRRFKLLEFERQTRLQFELERYVGLEPDLDDELTLKGVPTDEWPYLYGYSKRMYELYLKFTGETLQLEKQSLTNEYVLRGYSLTVLQQLQDVVDFYFTGPITYWEDRCESLAPWAGCAGMAALSADSQEGSWSIQILDTVDSCVYTRPLAADPQVPAVYWLNCWIKTYFWPGISGRVTRWMLWNVPYNIVFGFGVRDYALAGRRWLARVSPTETESPLEAKDTAWHAIKLKVEDTVGVELYVDDILKCSHSYAAAFRKPDQMSIWNSWFMGNRTDHMRLQNY